jgi:hypothetical protein
MRACSVFLLAFVLGGCTLRQGIAAGGAAVGTTGVIVLNSAYHDDQDDANVTPGATLLVAGLVTMFVAAALEEHERTRPEPIVVVREAPKPSKTVERRAAAGQLTKAAQAAARRDECDRVKVLDGQVHELDADLHAVVFMRDAAIQRCLAMPQVAPTPAVDPAPAPMPAPAPAPEPAPEPAPAPAPVPGPMPAPAAPPAAVPPAATP